MSEEQIDWKNISPTDAQRYWSSLSKKEKHQMWAKASKEEQQAIINVVPNKELEKLEFDPPQVHNSGPRSQEKVEEAEFELARIHREQLEEEVTRIRESVEEGIETSERRLQRRRTENIYVLVAIGIITGFFTVYPDFKISTQSVDLLAAGIAGASTFFLFIKLNTVSVGEFGQDTLWTKADRLADLLFQLSISGVFLLAIGTIGINALDISLTPESSSAFTFTIAIFATFLTYINSFRSKIYKSPSQDTIRFQEVQDRMFDLPDEDAQTQEENVAEFTDLLDEYKKHSDTTQTLEKIRKRVGHIRGLKDEQIERVQNHLDDLIEEKSRESKTEDELREMEREQREEQRKKYRDIIRGTESKE